MIRGYSTLLAKAEEISYTIYSQFYYLKSSPKQSFSITIDFNG